MLGTGIEVGLSDGLKLIEDIESQEMSFVDDEDWNLLGGDDVGEQGADEGIRSLFLCIELSSLATAC